MFGLWKLFKKIKEFLNFNVNEQVKENNSNISQNYQVIEDSNVPTMVEKDEQLIESEELQIKEIDKVEENKLSIIEIREMAKVNGYVFVDELENVNIEDYYSSYTELLMDFTELGIRIINR